MFTIKYVISKHTFSFTAHRILLSNIITTRINWHCLRFKSLTITRGAKRNRCARNVICAVSTRVQYAANRWSMLIGRTTGLEKVRSDSTCDRLHISAEDVNTFVYRSVFCLYGSPLYRLKVRLSVSGRKFVASLHREFAFTNAKSSLLVVQYVHRCTGVGYRSRCPDFLHVHWRLGC